MHVVHVNVFRFEPFSNQASVLRLLDQFRADLNFDASVDTKCECCNEN